MCFEPARQGVNFGESPETSRLDTVCAHFLAMKENKVVAVGGWNSLRQTQKIDGDRQGHPGKAADFETADTDQDSRSEALAEKR